MTENAASDKTELKVFISGREGKCDSCGKELHKGAWITLVEGAGARCLACADLDALVFLPSGNAALTRRSKAHSKLSAVVLKWSRARKRYERQGLLVQEPALAQAENESLADAEARERKRMRSEARRENLDQEFVARFAARVRELFPGLPAGRETKIAEHACLKSSGRVGRSAAAKEFERAPVELAVRAHIRHVETDYDELLMSGLERDEARSRVSRRVEEVLEKWRGAGA